MPACLSSGHRSFPSPHFSSSGQEFKRPRPENVPPKRGAPRWTARTSERHRPAVAVFVGRDWPRRRRRRRDGSGRRPGALPVHQPRRATVHAPWALCGRRHRPDAVSPTSGSAAHRSPRTDRALAGLPGRAARLGACSRRLRGVRLVANPTLVRYGDSIRLWDVRVLARRVARQVALRASPCCNAWWACW